MPSATTTPKKAQRRSQPRLPHLTAAARVWVVCQTLGPDATREQVLAATKRLGVHERTAVNHFNIWRYARKQAAVASHLPKPVRTRILAAAHVHAA